VQHTAVAQDDEVNITMNIEIANCKGALQIRPDEIVLENLLDAAYQNTQNVIEFWIGCGNNDVHKEQNSLKLFS